VAVVRRNRFIETMWRVHRGVFKATRGRLGTRIGKLPVLALTVKGRRSGAPRTVMLMYMEHEGTPVVFGSNAGEPRPPAWWLNLQQDPRATVQTKAGTWAARAREAEGAERERLWTAIGEITGDYAEYERRAGRRLPVVLLERAESPS
jgi:deazaflavin-dependent oxidoreductase (nitroreductase family)